MKISTRKEAIDRGQFKRSAPQDSNPFGCRAALMTLRRKRGEERLDPHERLDEENKGNNRIQLLLLVKGKGKVKRESE
jgi:hypothetical protein